MFFSKSTDSIGLNRVVRQLLSKSFHWSDITIFYGCLKMRRIIRNHLFAYFIDIFWLNYWNLHEFHSLYFLKINKQLELNVIFSYWLETDLYQSARTKKKKKKNTLNRGSFGYHERGGVLIEGDNKKIFTMDSLIIAPPFTLFFFSLSRDITFIFLVKAQHSTPPIRYIQYTC